MIARSDQNKKELEKLRQQKFQRPAGAPQLRPSRWEQQQAGLAANWVLAREELLSWFLKIRVLKTLIARWVASAKAEEKAHPHPMDSGASVAAGDEAEAEARARQEAEEARAERRRELLALSATLVGLELHMDNLRDRTQLHVNQVEETLTEAKNALQASLVQAGVRDEKKLAAMTVALENFVAQAWPTSRLAPLSAGQLPTLSRSPQPARSALDLDQWLREQLSLHGVQLASTPGLQLVSRLVQRALTLIRDHIAPLLKELEDTLGVTEATQARMRALRQDLSDSAFGKEVQLVKDELENEAHQFVSPFKTRPDRTRPEP